MNEEDEGSGEGKGKEEEDESSIYGGNREYEQMKSNLSPKSARDAAAAAIATNKTQKRQQ